MAITVLVAALIMISAQVSASAESAEHGDHLEPEDSQFLLSVERHTAGYERFLWDYFAEAYARDVVLRVIAIPALGPWEHAVGIRRDGDRYSIFFVAPQILIGRRWRDASAGFPQDHLRSTDRPFRCGTDHTIWKRMVMASRYPEAHTTGLDGTRYHFSVHVYGNVSYGGQIWSPPEHTLTGKLVALSDLMAEFCLHPGGERLRYGARLSRYVTAWLRSLPH